ncbi:MAG: GGDEF domain-containing protein [Comamonas sp.]
MTDPLPFTFAQYASICNSLPDPTFILTESGRYAAVLGGKDKRYYHDGSSLVGKYLYNVLAPSKCDWFLAQIRRAILGQQMLVVEYDLSQTDVLGIPADGPAEPIWFEGRITPLQEQFAGETSVMWVASNITHTKRLQQQLHQLAMSDDLTGLRNRRYFMDNLRIAFENFHGYGRPGCLIYMDVDYFKAINDTLGHQIGDQALRDVALAIQRQFAADDVFCRLGGDEFALLCQGRSLDNIALLAQQLLSSGQQALKPYVTSSYEPSLSLGIAHFQATDESMHSVMQRADQALYTAKLRKPHSDLQSMR